MRKYRKGNKKWTILRNWQHLVHNTQDANKQNKNNKNKIPQITGCKDEPNIVCIRIAQRTSQHGTQNVKAHNRTTIKRKLKRWATWSPPVSHGWTRVLAKGKPTLIMKDFDAFTSILNLITVSFVIHFLFLFLMFNRE